MEFFDMIISQYGSVHRVRRKSWEPIGSSSCDRSAPGNDQVLDAIADNCRLSRQEVKWEFRYHKENTNA